MSTKFNFDYTFFLLTIDKNSSRDSTLERDIVYKKNVRPKNLFDFTNMSIVNYFPLVLYSFLATKMFYWFNQKI